MIEILLIILFVVTALSVIGTLVFVISGMFNGGERVVFPYLTKIWLLYPSIMYQVYFWATYYNVL